MTAGTDVAKAAKAAGFPDDQLVTAVAIAFAESTFNAGAIKNEPDGSKSYGLWQINSVHGYPEIASGAWRQPGVNAQLAKRVYDKQGWEAWSTFRPSDAVGYARYLAARPAAVGFVAAGVGAEAAAKGAIDTPGAVASGITADAAQALNIAAEIAKEPLAVLRWLTLPQTWVRIAYVVGGLALVIAGVNLFVTSAIASRAAPVVENFVGGKAKAVTSAIGGSK